MDAARSHKLEFLGIFSFDGFGFFIDGTIYSLIVSSRPKESSGLNKFNGFCGLLARAKARAKHETRAPFRKLRRLHGFELPRRAIWPQRIASEGRNNAAIVHSVGYGWRAPPPLRRAPLSLFPLPITVDLFHFLQENRFAAHFNFSLSSFYLECSSKPGNFMNFFGSLCPSGCLFLLLFILFPQIFASRCPFGAHDCSSLMGDLGECSSLDGVGESIPSKTEAPQGKSCFHLPQISLVINSLDRSRHQIFAPNFLIISLTRSIFFPLFRSRFSSARARLQHYQKSLENCVLDA